MKRTGLLLVLALAACGGSGGKPTAVTTPTTADTAVPPALFAALFVDGKAFKYAVTTESSHWDDQDPKADQNGNVLETTHDHMSCRVHGLQNFSHAIAAKVECDDASSLGDLSPDAVWVATGTGIWRLDAFPLDDAAIDALDPKQMVLAAQPVETTVDSGDADTGEAWSVVHEARGWCRTHTFVSGDEGGSSICFAQGFGLAGGGSSFAGGSTKDVTYELIQ
jgi:ketosteroid isomerase-like protein